MLHNNLEIYSSIRVNPPLFSPSGYIAMYLLEVFLLSYPDVRQFNASVTNEGSLKPKNFCTVLSTYGLISSMSFFERLDVIFSYILWNLKIQINIDKMKIFNNGVSYWRKLQCPKHIGSATLPTPFCSY
jgi:hypothetical protein